MSQDSANTPEAAAMRGQMRQLLEKTIDGLPDSYRTVFVLRAVEEMSGEEVAACLEIPEATVRSRFFRARSLLRTALALEVDCALESAFALDGVRCDRIVAGVLAQLDLSGKERPAAKAGAGPGRDVPGPSQGACRRAGQDHPETGRPAGGGQGQVQLPDRYAEDADRCAALRGDAGEGRRQRLPGRGAAVRQSDLAKAAASILGDEAMHWAVLRNALGEAPVPSAFMS
jgi:hypothetical protein